MSTNWWHMCDCITVTCSAVAVVGDILPTRTCSTMADSQETKRVVDQQCTFPFRPKCSQSAGKIMNYSRIAMSSWLTWASDLELWRLKFRWDAVYIDCGRPCHFLARTRTRYHLKKFMKRGSIIWNQQQMHLQPTPLSSLSAPGFCDRGTMCIVVVYPNGNFCATVINRALTKKCVSTFERKIVFEKATPVQ